MKDQIQGPLDKVTAALKDHYSASFEAYGATAKGVGWNKKERARVRYDKMLAVLDHHISEPTRARPSLLDVGCGYGGLLIHAQQRGIEVDYTGIDPAENMITYARENYPRGRFILGDVLTWEPEESFDYVVCNGILTKKLDASIPEMEAFTCRLVRKIFQLCRVGTAFNVMTTLVDYMEPDLYYKSPSEMLAFCLGALSRHVAIDHGYPLYEYTVYIFAGPEYVE